jgi:hypothetical protein
MKVLPHCMNVHFTPLLSLRYFMSSSSSDAILASYTQPGVTEK